MQPASSGWKCLQCAFVTEVNPADDDCPTCGQRSTKYCPQCEDMQTVEYTLNTTVSVRVHATPVVDSVPHHVVAQVVAQLPNVVCDPCTAGPPPALATMTVEQLAGLQVQLEASLAAVKRELRDRSLCVVCLDRSKAVIFYPCKHKVTCKQCAESLSSCPLCRQRIAETILPFDS